MEFKLIQQELYNGKVRKIGKEEAGLYLLLKNLTRASAVSILFGRKEK